MVKTSNPSASSQMTINDGYRATYEIRDTEFNKPPKCKRSKSTNPPN